MSHPLSRRAALQAAAASGLALALPAARACEFYTSTLRVVHPYTSETLLADGAAVVCMTIDEVVAQDRLVGVLTPVADSADIGGLAARPQVDLSIPKGQVTVLHEGASYVRLTGLKHSLLVGRSYPLTLFFEKGGAVDAELTVDFARVNRPAKTA